MFPVAGFYRLVQIQVLSPEGYFFIELGGYLLQPAGG